MWKIRLIATGLVLAGVGVGYFIFSSEQAGGRFAFKLGLDLSGGTHLIYKADVSRVDQNDIRNAMEALRDVIERRVNLFGVTEPMVQVERTQGIISGTKEERLIVELPGITNIDEAVAMIGQTPLLEFKLESPNSPERQTALEAIQNAVEAKSRGEKIDVSTLPQDDFLFVDTGLSGRYLEKATIFFNPTTGAPGVTLGFNKEGGEIFARITKENIGKTLAIYLDGTPISIPVIREEITGGKAEITGTFTPQEAKILVGRLNSGALPVPIELLGSQTIGSSLGKEAQERGVKAGIIGSLFVAIFMILWYRLPGIIAVFALSIYIVLMLGFFKLIPVTLTVAGIAGFILSIGMADDANVLIF